MINFVSNLPQEMQSGGFSGLNAAAFSAISKVAVVNYVGPINPPVFLAEKVRSKVLRVVGSQGTFFFFSERRLQAIAYAVQAQCLNAARLDVFHGFTPWVLSKPQRPYLAWSDCTFRDYIEMYHCRAQFRKEDLERIERSESAWLRSARRVLFTSDWAARRAVESYGLDVTRVRVVGIFGAIEMPARDVYGDGKDFVFVATNFEAKGGRTVLAAFREVRRRHPDAALIIIGDQPSNVIAQPGVEFLGFLRKEVRSEIERYQHVLSRARALLLPTKSDIAPLIIVEAGYFGCPPIASKRFAIPELVDDGRTGLLLDDPSKVSAVADAMNWMLEQEDEYRRMRRAAWAKAREQYSRPRFEDLLLAFVSDAVSGGAVPAR